MRSGNRLSYNSFFSQSLDAYHYPYLLLNRLEEEKKGRKMTGRKTKM